MSDPLGLIGQTGGAGGARGVERAANAVSRAPEPGEPRFKDVLLKNLEEVNQLQQDATRAIEDFQTGKRDDLESVILATQKADTAFKMLQQLRNKVMDAYDEIKQMRV